MLIEHGTPFFDGGSSRKADSTALREDEDAGAAFTTYLNYLQNLAILVRQIHADDCPERGVHAATKALPDVVSTKTKRLADADTARLKNHLRISWLREGRMRALAEQYVRLTQLGDDLLGAVGLARHRSVLSGRS